MPNNQPPPKLGTLGTNILLGVVVVTGSVNFFAKLFIKGWEPDWAITVLFVGVLGTHLGVRSVVYRRRNGQDDG